MLSTNLPQFLEQIRNTTAPINITEITKSLEVLVDNCTPTKILGLIQLLDHQDPAIAALIAKALEQLAPDSVEPLLVAFDGSADHGVQARIVQILANIGDDCGNHNYDRTLELLVEMVGVEIANHCQGNVRRIAARGLGKMLRSQGDLAGSLESLKAIDKLIWALLNPEDWALRYAAAVSLGEIATEKAMIALQQALVQESDRVVQQRISFVLSA